MDYKAALESLKKLEGGAELVSAVETELERLTNKNYELIGENRKAGTKSRSLEDAFNAIATTLGLEGEDLESKLSSAPEKVKSLSTQLSEANTKLTATETRATEAETKVQGFERKTKLTDIAAAAGASAAVLERLLGDKLDELKIEGEGESRTVKLGDKPLREAIAADEGLKPFEAALFPAQSTTTTTPSPKLPSGTPDSQTSNAADVAYERATGRSQKSDMSWVTGQ